MIHCEWKDFSTDTETYTRADFEELVGDEYEAMMIEEGKTIPTYIWTTNFVCLLKQNTRVLSDISITKILRNPECE